VVAREERTDLCFLVVHGEEREDLRHHDAAGAGARDGGGRRSSLAGLPATIVCGATSAVTTLPAPTSAPSPTVTPQRMTAPLPMDARVQTRVATAVQSAPVWGVPSGLTASG
jgi:hypothetical protein